MFQQLIVRTVLWWESNLRKHPLLLLGNVAHELATVGFLSRYLRSSQCSTTGVIKAVVCVILSVR